MFNKIILVGNLTRQIELRYTPSGQAVAKGGIATNRKWKDQSGQQKEEVMFIDFTIWGRSAEIANQYLHKGSKVLLEGRLSLEQWTDQSGQKRSKHVVTVENLKMLDGKGQAGGQDPQQGGQDPQQGGQDPQQGGQDPQQTPPQQQQQQQQAPQQAQMPPIEYDDSDIPFAYIGLSEGKQYIHVI
ncbi:single-stranded DNA-binding protein [Hydrogenimonas urashimensis]|uniref:single-stranded DNA-binding protein n=1 Tax=Hydrogenimonas urashimensis TaxID=2740515 RepID=UPI001915EBB8|nr:single-stranded DNA-binding protein [Hydrogenimonas urashimensis]